jgi:hypothetical protein
VVTHYHPSFKVRLGSNQARQSWHGLTSIFMASMLGNTVYTIFLKKNY